MKKRVKRVKYSRKEYLFKNNICLADARVNNNCAASKLLFSYVTRVALGNRSFSNIYSKFGELNNERGENHL